MKRAFGGSGVSHGHANYVQCQTFSLASKVRFGLPEAAWAARY